MSTSSASLSSSGGLNSATDLLSRGGFQPYRLLEEQMRHAYSQQYASAATFDPAMYTAAYHAAALAQAQAQAQQYSHPAFRYSLSHALLSICFHFSMLSYFCRQPFANDLNCGHQAVISALCLRRSLILLSTYTHMPCALVQTDMLMYSCKYSIHKYIYALKHIFNCDGMASIISTVTVIMRGRFY